LALRAKNKTLRGADITRAKKNQLARAGAISTGASARTKRALTTLPDRKAEVTNSDSEAEISSEV
jgi:hypothetical protein